MSSSNVIKHLVLCLLFLPSCSMYKNDEATKSVETLVDLAVSTKIICTVIAQNKLGQLLEDHDPEQLDLLINNFSPAQLAFESEVLSTTVPLVVIYYYREDAKEQEFIKQLKALAIEYNNKVKFVIVDVDKLFSLAQDAEISIFPAIIISRKRDIIEKITQPITINEIGEKIAEQSKLI